MSSTGRTVILSLLCVAAAVGALLLVRPGHAATRLFVHAGAGIRPPLDELGRLFEEETGVRPDYSYKGSGCLLADITFSSRGDVYIPGELYYMEQAQERGFVAESKVIGAMSTVIIVPRGNPKDIRGLSDLARPGLRVGIGDPNAVAAGRAAREALEKAGLVEAVERNVAAVALNVQELGIGVKLGHLDAAIVWDATAHLFRSDVDTIPVAEEWRVASPIPVGLLVFSEHPREAKEFLEFLASDRAREVFLRHGYGAPLAKGGSAG